MIIIKTKPHSNILITLLVSNPSRQTNKPEHNLEGHHENRNLALSKAYCLGKCTLLLLLLALLPRTLLLSK